MKRCLLPLSVVLSGIMAAQMCALAKSSFAQPPDAKAHASAKHDVGSGAGDIGKGAAKGVGSAAKGTAKSAADLVTRPRAYGELGILPLISKVTR